jgi:hypothetical protein
VKASHFLMGFLAFLMVGSSTASEPSSVDARVQALEETVRALEARLASVEAQLRAAATPTPYTPAGGGAKANWRKLQNGMTEADVERLLGSPSRVDRNQFHFYWYYGDRMAGQVEFDPKLETVKGWSEP